VAASALALIALFAVQFNLPRQSFLVDDVIPISVSGLTPGDAVTVRAHAGAWSSSATFTADSSGAVSVADPMRLFWSATRERSAPQEAPPQMWELTAEVKGMVVARTTVQRRALAESVTVAHVRERGLVGDFYLPAGEGKHPAVLVLGGSGGGIPPASGFAGGLASRGYAVFALAYFGVEGLPRNLENIPLEYFGAALTWLAAQPSVDADRIAVVGSSRGAELALLLGAVYPRIRAVVAFMPSNVVWGGCCDRIGAPSWTINRRPVVLRSEIPVEQIHGGVLLISGRDDGVWHSTSMADAIMARLRRHDFAYAYKHLAYDNAGHAIGRPYTPTTDLDDVRHPLTGRLMHFGGTAEGTAHAREDAWRETLTFLAAQLSPAASSYRTSPPTSSAPRR
jgi:dienelactone hydrolase